MKRLFKLYRIEQKKLRYRKTYLLLAAMLLMEMAWIWNNFHDAQEQWKGMEYLGMVYVIPQMVVIFFPLTIAILASRLCDMEHKGNNFKMLVTLENRNQLYVVKILEGVKYIMILSITQLLMILGMGWKYSFEQRIPMDNLIYLFLEIFVISISLFEIQLLLSLWIENQMIPLIVGLVGSFSGLFTLFIPQIRYYTIWGYYALLAPVNFWWDEESRDFGVMDTPCAWGKLIIFIGISIVLFIIGDLTFKRKEV